MAELTVRQDELVVTMEPREKRSLTWFGLRTSRSKLLDGSELRVPLANVTGARAADSAYWELRDQMDARNAMGAGRTRGRRYEPSENQRWTGIFHVTQDGAEKKELCFIYGQDSPGLRRVPELPVLCGMWLTGRNRTVDKGGHATRSCRSSKSA
jgi:hypothetical protein